MNPVTNLHKNFWRTMVLVRAEQNFMESFVQLVLFSAVLPVLVRSWVKNCGICCSAREMAREVAREMLGKSDAGRVINKAKCWKTRFLLINKKLFVYLQPPKYGEININYLFTNIYAYNSAISSQRTRGYCREEQVSRVGCLSSEKRSMRTCVHYYT